MASRYVGWDAADDLVHDAFVNAPDAWSAVSWGREASRLDDPRRHQHGVG